MVTKGLSEKEAFDKELEEVTQGECRCLEEEHTWKTEPAKETQKEGLLRNEGNRV